MNKLWLGVVSPCLLASCGGGKAGGTSPQEVFDNVKTAIAAKDFKTFYKCFDPQKAELLVFFCLRMGAYIMKRENKDTETEMEQILKSHGLDPKKKPAMNADGYPDEMAKDSFAGVKDKAALFSDLMGFVRKHSKDKDPMTYIFSNTTLKDVKVEGDSASGTSTNAEGNTSPAKFVKREGVWYLAFDIK